MKSPKKSPRTQSLPSLPRGTKFEVGKTKKYTAYVPHSDGKIKKVQFGAKGYQHYKDRVPKSMGGGKYSKFDHLDEERRQNYRSRHAGILTKNGERAIDQKYSPAWFSYYFLW